ncbi:hypothetical protein [Arthrobacter ulcerisalmonis]|uniref:hypothetical protein n=1 Tax=Arthrobacter ulcerisalmonis TaxID=2483813 RepID=UPI003636C026
MNIDFGVGLGSPDEAYFAANPESVVAKVRQMRRLNPAGLKLMRFASGNSKPALRCRHDCRKGLLGTPRGNAT